MKNKAYYILIQLLGLVLRVVAIVIYPVVFLLRHGLFDWATEHFFEDENRMFVMQNGHKKWKVYFHPYFWLFCFTTGLTDEWWGPDWYKNKLKTKLINNYYKSEDIEVLLYFWICFCWQALRNAHWAFNEWFFREGKWKPDTEHWDYCDPADGYIYRYWDIMPQLKWDEEGNDGGKVLRFPPDDIQANGIWLYTHLGKKKITFTTSKGNSRFMYAYCKVIYFRRLKLIIEHQFGWNYWNGIPIMHFKHILRKN